MMKNTCKFDMREGASEPLVGQKRSNPLPRWRGFNLLELFTENSSGSYSEEDFRLIAEWGFNMVRLSATYRWWCHGDNLREFDDDGMERVDRAVELGNRYNLHVSLNFHRGPSYSVSKERTEPFNLWKDSEALELFCLHWQTFAMRYQGIPGDRLSFDLINEPPPVSPGGMTRADYAKVVRETVAAIRKVDPDRSIIAEGVDWGNCPCEDLADLKLSQSCRGYLPISVSHYMATWMGVDHWQKPVWPEPSGTSGAWNRGKMHELYARWAAMFELGIGVHCGEMGVFRFTPHQVALAWMKDLLAVLAEYGIGWGLWNFRGAFGIMDSERSDVKYEKVGHRLLDREMLELLRLH